MNAIYCTISIGDVHCSGRRCFQWTIDDFLSSALNAPYGVKSPAFEFEGGSHFLYINLDRKKENSVELAFLKEGETPLPTLHVTLRLSTGFRGKLETRSGKVNESGNFTVRVWMLCSEFLERRLQILNEGRLTVFCELKRLDVKEKAEVLQEQFLGQVKAAEESSDRDSDDEETIPKWKNLLSLSNNLKELFQSREGCDVTIIVKDRQLQAHSAILQARSIVFSSMMTHDMGDRSSHEVRIDDCEHGAVQELLHFLYTGKVENLTVDNMQHVYYAADKYEVADLKSECVEFMKKSLSTKVICGVIDLAVKHLEPDLLTYATEYFIENIHEILGTLQWQTFLQENPREANKLYIQAL